MSFKLYVQPDQQELDISANQTILDGTLAAEIPHAHACGGRGRCSSCRVLVTEGLERCSPRNKIEQILAEKLNFRDYIRLACQTHISGPVSIKRAVLDEIDMTLIREDFGDGPTMLGKEIEATMMFADIEGYTSLTEKALPYDIVHLLNRYYFIMGQIIAQYNGRIMDYFGDGFLAIFGMDGDIDHARHALYAAKEMQIRMADIHTHFGSLYDRTLRMRVGIHTGPVIVGSVGAKGMRKVAAIGDTVNLASRLEAKNKEFGTYALLSAESYEKIKDEVQLIAQYETEFAGKTGIYTVYAIDLHS